LERSPLEYFKGFLSYTVCSPNIDERFDNNGGNTVKQTLLMRALVLLILVGNVLAQPAQKTSEKGKKMNKEIATVAGGCFWCIEAPFDELVGVQKAVSGYSGGHVRNPTYEQVTNKTTGHAEVVQITFDPTVISYRELLEVLFTLHDPTTLNRQGNDVGPQYRSAIFYHSPEQKEIAEKFIAEQTAAKVWKDPIVTEVTKFSEFFSAEAYHQEYYVNNPNQGYCSYVIAPKIKKFRKVFAAKLKVNQAKGQ
jgi:peptide-methionine (S)-S-oxide reductase